MKTTNFWTEDSPRPAELAVAAPPETTDVAVIGGGYTGLHVALELRRRGADVAVLEAHTIGWGASSRNGGMATSGLKAETPALFKQYGPDRGRAFWEWAQDAIDHVERTCRDEAIACDFARTGHLLLAYKPAHFKRMRHEAEWFRRELQHESVSVLAPSDLRAEYGGGGYHGALLDTSSAALHPARYVFGLAQAAARYGALLVEDAPVSAVQREEGGWRVVTRRGSVKAREVLLATNGYTTDLVPEARRGIFPGGSYIITTDRLPAEVQAELSPHGRMFFDSKHFLNYFRLTPDGRMLFGGRHNLSTNLRIEESAQMLRRRMVQVFPQLMRVPISHSWTGKLGLTFDLMPHIGRVQGIWYAYGYAGHGVAMASKMGKEVAEMIAGARASSLFSEIPHHRYPFTPWDRYYLPLVSAWFRALDLVQ